MLLQIIVKYTGMTGMCERLSVLPNQAATSRRADQRVRGQAASFIEFSW